MTDKFGKLMDTFSNLSSETQNNLINSGTSIANNYISSQNLNAAQIQPGYAMPPIQTVYAMPPIQPGYAMPSVPPMPPMQQMPQMQPGYAMQPIPSAPPQNLLYNDHHNDYNNHNYNDYNDHHNDHHNDHKDHNHNDHNQYDHNDHNHNDHKNKGHQEYDDEYKSNKKSKSRVGAIPDPFANFTGGFKIFLQVFTAIIIISIITLIIWLIIKSCKAMKGLLNEATANGLNPIQWFVDPVGSFNNFIKYFFKGMWSIFTGW